jgi:hypothetical protein
MYTLNQQILLQCTLRLLAPGAKNKIRHCQKIDVCEKGSINFLTYSPRTNRNFGVTVMPSSKGLYDAHFPTYNSVLATVDMRVFENNLLCLYAGNTRVFLTICRIRRTHSPHPPPMNHLLNRTTWHWQSSCAKSN